VDLDTVIDLLAAQPARTAILTDFDGTLAEVMADPGAVTPLPGATDALVALTEAGFGVTVISGRPVTFLAERLPDALDLSGLYGLEWRRDGMVGEHPGAGVWGPVISEVVERARRDLSGVLVEPKRLTLTLHYRQCPDRQAEIERFARREGERTGLEARPAKMSVELHPPIAADKGTAVEEALVTGPPVEVAAFLGDDVGDLPAFAALERLAARGMRTVRVGVVTSETPPELLAVTDVSVAGPAAAVSLLEDLAQRAVRARRAGR
jgi:trehalose 6-phosphate phosphatase